MKKRFMFSLSILPLLMLISCSGSPEEQSATPPSPPTGQASPPPVAPPPATPPAGSQATNPPVISDKEIAQKGLVPSTNPEQRLKEIKQARNNPFSLIPVVAQVTPVGGYDTPNPDTQGTTNNQPTTEDPGGSKGTPRSSPIMGSRPKQAPFYPIGKYCKFEGKIGGSIIEIQPEEAQGILVSGIVKLPTAAYAIITPRNSKVTQSVRKGSFLGNGLVRVAAIDPVNETVIFEENGKFVYREIGQRPVATKSGIVQLKGESFPFKIKPPTSKQAYGTIVKGKKALMLTQASILLVNVAGEDKSGTLQQLASPPWARNPNPNTSAPGEVPAPTQPGGKGTQGTNSPPAPTNSPQGTGGSTPVSQASAPQKSTRLSGAICNDSNKRITVSRIKIQIQDAETNTVLDTQWSDVASTNVVLDRGQSAKFDVPIPRLQNSSSGTISVRLLDWQGG